MTWFSAASMAARRSRVRAASSGPGAGSALVTDLPRQAWAQSRQSSDPPEPARSAAVTDARRTGGPPERTGHKPGRTAEHPRRSPDPGGGRHRSEEHTSELQSHSFISYAVFCLKKKKN